jgi:hypothetical protein
MTEPTKKSPGIEILLTNLAGNSRTSAIESDFCVWCKKDASQFRDELSKREYAISGLCQKCQDSVFG